MNQMSPRENQTNGLQDFQDINFFQDQDIKRPELNRTQSKSSFTSVFDCEQPKDLLNENQRRAQMNPLKIYEIDSLIFGKQSVLLSNNSNQHTMISEEIIRPQFSVPCQTRAINVFHGRKASEGKQKITKAVLKSATKENNRVGKNSQPEAQRFLRLAHGYYYNKNFQQYYHNRLSYMFPGQIAYNQLSKVEKIEAIDWIINEELHKYQFSTHRSFETQLLKNQLGLEEIGFVKEFYQELFHKVYEIMLRTQKRRLEGSSIFDENITSRYLDVEGQRELEQSFETVYSEITNRTFARSGNLNHQHIMLTLRKLM